MKINDLMRAYHEQKMLKIKEKLYTTVLRILETDDIELYFKYSDYSDEMIEGRDDSW